MSLAPSLKDDVLEPILIVSDAHRPYHDERAWQLMLKVGRELKPKILITIGDLADFYAVSAHSKNPTRSRQLAEELGIVLAGLDDLDGLGAKEKYFVAGNHEDRLRRYLQDKAPELFGIVGIPTLFNLKDRGWTYVPYKDDTRVGKLFLTHDVGNSGRTSVFNALDTYQHSVVTGHSHRLAYIVEGNAAGEYKVSAQFGWLGDVGKIDYMNRAKAKKNWALGFGIGYLDRKTGVTYLTPVPIVKYSCCVNGKLFEL